MLSSIHETFLRGNAFINRVVVWITVILIWPQKNVYVNSVAFTYSAGGPVSALCLQQANHIAYFILGITSTISYIPSILQSNLELVSACRL